MSNKVIYLTGAPTAGKSSVSAWLRLSLPSLQVWEYGRQSSSLTQAELEERSSGVATPEDINAVDDLLLDLSGTDARPGMS